jgi:predicted RND superfamily exporter protein
MKGLADLVIRNRKLVIGLTLLVTMVLGYFIKDIRIDPDITNSLPKGDPIVEVLSYIGEEYGGNQMALIAIETHDIFNKGTLERVAYLTERFRRVDGVSQVISITNVVDIKEDEYGMEISKLIDEYDIPQTQEELSQLKAYTLSKDMYRGRLVSQDATATLMICLLREGVDKIATVKELRGIVSQEKIEEQVYFGGYPFLMLDISDAILDDLKVLVPLVSLIIILTLYFSFRTARGVIVPLLSVVVSIIWTLGIMGLFKVPLTLVSDVIPVILMAVGSAYGIHVISKFNEVPGTDREYKVALREVAGPVSLAAITTVGGFLSFVFNSYLTMIRDFGIFSSLGIILALLVSLTLVPAVLSLLPQKGEGTLGGERKGFIDRLVDGLCKWVILRKNLIIALSLIIVVLSILGMPKITRNVDILDYFRSGTKVRSAEEILKDKFGGSTLLQILVKGDIQDPNVLKKMKELEDYLVSRGDINNVQSIVGLIEEMSYALGEGRAIPDSREKVGNLWFLLEGEETMEQMVTSNRDEALIQATISSGLNTERIHELVNGIEEKIDGLTGPDVSFIQTGMPTIHRDLDVSIMLSQVQSIVITLSFVFICLLFLFRSVTGGIVGLIPITFTLLVIYGVMGHFGIPQDIATVLVGSISMGIGIDYSIHFVNRFIKESKGAKNSAEAVERTIKTTGKAITINVLTVTTGFLVLGLASLVPLQRFGLLVALTMLSSGFSAMTLLPAILLSLDGRRITAKEEVIS